MLIYCSEEVSGYAQENVNKCGESVTKNQLREDRYKVAKMGNPIWCKLKDLVLTISQCNKPVREACITSPRVPLEKSLPCKSVCKFYMLEAL